MIIFKYTLCVMVICIGCKPNEDQVQENLNTYYKLEHLESNLCTLKFMDDEGEMVTIHDIIEHGSVVVLIYSSSSCWACVSDYLEIFNSVGSLFNGKVIVIANGVPLRSIRIRAIQYSHINFLKPIDENLMIGPYLLANTEPAMCLVSDNCKIQKFRWGLAKDSIGNSYFDDVQTFLKNN